MSPKLHLPILSPGLQGPIPPVLHHVWVGGPVPEWVRVNWGRWEEFLSSSDHAWEIRKWTDETVADFPVMNLVAQVADDHELPPRGKADLLRVAALWAFGGMYMDCDLVPLRSLDDLILEPGISFWATSHAPSRDQKIMANGCFAVCAKSEFMSLIIESAQRSLDKGVTDEHYLAGPRAYRRYLPSEDLVEWDLVFKASRSERRTMAAGGEFDYDDLRAKYSGRVKHIGPIFEDAS